MARPIAPEERPTMRAVGFMDFGGPEVLQSIETPRPTILPDEVLVQIVAASVNPTDILMREGRQAAMMTELRPPFVAGFEFAGHVVAAGASVLAFAVGQPVMGCVNARRPGGGAHAEYVAVPAVSLAAIDADCDLTAAATVPLNGLTAKLAIDRLDLCPGAAVLVTGGAGVLASYVIAFAREAGLVVVADAAHADLACVRSRHADHVVPRGDAMPAAVRRLYPDGVDGLIDTALLGEAAGGLVRDGGSAVAVRRSHSIEDPRLRSCCVSFLDQLHNAADLAWLAQTLQQRRLAPRVAAVMPMREARRAHALVAMGGLRGRVVLTFGETPS